MRIALVSEHASPLAVVGGVDAGGQNVYVDALARGLAARGHTVDVYTRRDRRDLPERAGLAPGVTVVHVPAGPPVELPKDDLLPWMPAFGWWMARDWLGLRRSGQPIDLVHSHFWMSGLAAAEAVSSVRSVTGQRIPSVQTFHALGSVKRRMQGAQDTSPGTRIDAEVRLVRRSSAVLATCRDEVRELRALAGPAGTIHVVPCGVDLDHFRAVGRVTRPSVAPALPPGSTRLLTVGRLVERKGAETIIRALPALPDAHLLVAGGPPAGQLGADPEAQRLRALAAGLEVGDRLHLLGQVGRAELPALYRWSDVVVATPWYEPFGMVPLEAMACGRPVVASAVGGLLDTVVPGRTGVLVPPRDPVALAQALRDLLGDPARLEAYGRAGRARAIAEYGWNRIAEAVDGVYASVAVPAPMLSVEAL